MNIRFFLILLGITTMLFLIFFGVSAYGYYQALHADDPIDPVLFMDTGTGKIIRDDTAIVLSEQESYILEEEDIIETEKGGYGTITWPDQSITRLGVDTRIIIRKMRVSQNYDTIQVSYDMKRGKVWNTVIRVLLGDSYFEARLPKDNIIAGVRGTVFEVNLDAGYIHAVEHSTKLSDKTGKLVYLLPGELVSSENIWVKKGREWLDRGWQEWNTLKDKSYETLRSFEIQKQLEWISGESLMGQVGRIGNIASGAKDTDALSQITEALSENNLDILKNIDTKTLLLYYQRIGGGTYDREQDMIRGVILEKNEAPGSIDGLTKLFREISLWESLETGNIVPSLRESLSVDNTTLSAYRDILREGDTIETISSTLQEKIRSMIQN